MAELNKVYLEKNKLENIFNDCVNQTKKLIYNRKLKDNKSYKIKNKTGLGKYDCKINITTKFEEFLPGDKQSTLENFLFNEEVFFDVLWQSEDTFILRYEDESHGGKYAEEYLIRLP